MTAAQDVSALGAAATLRQHASGAKTGFKALWSSLHVLSIALFASFGGLLYGYQQGVLGQALVMPAFKRMFPHIASNSSAKGWLTSILQLGGWAGALSAGVLCEVFSRKHTIFGGSLWVILGSYLTAGARTEAYLYAGRFFTGVGVGILSATGPLYNAELAPPEIRGLLVSMQQLATTIGIMSAYWVGYGTNYIGGTGEGQRELAWRLPLIIQGIPAVILAIGVWLLPFSPRLLVNHGRDDEALKTLGRLRRLPVDHRLIRIEYLEIKAESEFEKRSFDKKFPKLASKAGSNKLLRELAQYTNIFRTKDSFKRVAIGGAIMFFQQWSGIDSIIYYAPIVFQSLGFTDNTTSLLATGVVGVINVLTTIPAMLFIDKVGRKKLLICGSIGMLICQLVTGVIGAKYQSSWASNKAAGWGAVVMIWLYIVNFAYSWGPASWTLISEIFPLSIRAKGTSISASSNWMNNFAVAFMTPPMLSGLKWGTFIFFSVWCLIGGLFVFFVLPETKGKTLEEMDIVFGSTTSIEDAELLASIQEEIGLIDMLREGSETAKEAEHSYLHHVPTIADPEYSDTSLCTLDMQGVLSFTAEQGANKRRKALRACQRCKDSKKRCTLIEGSPSCKRCTEDGWTCSFKGLELPSPVEPRSDVQPGLTQGDSVDTSQTQETSSISPEYGTELPRSSGSATSNPPASLPASTLLWNQEEGFHPDDSDNGVGAELQSTEEVHQGPKSELRYATMLSLRDKKDLNSTSETQATKLISGTNPLSALLGKELKHKIVTNSCSFRTPDPAQSGNRPAIHRGTGIHSCDWEQFYRAMGVSEPRLQYLRAIECFRLPTPSRCAELLEIFFLYVHPMMPVIDRRDFLSRYYGGDEPPSLIILHAVFLAASRYADNSGHSPDGLSEVRIHCDELHGKLRALIEAEITFERIAVIQASLLASLHWEGREGLNSAIDNLSLAVRACQEMGLHRKQQSTSSHPGAQEVLQRRLWWCLYALDRFNAAQEGTPFLINELECDVEMLTEKDLAGEDQLTQSVTLLNVSLARLIEDTIRNLYMPGEDHTTLFSSRGALTRQRLGLQLEQLARQINDKLMPGGDISRDSPRHASDRSSLFGAILLTHTPPIPTISRASKYGLNTLLASDQLRFSWPFTVYAVVNCLLIFWYDISAPSSQDMTSQPEARQHYTSVVHLLRIMGTTWWAASAKYRLAQALAHAADELHLKNKRKAMEPLESSRVPGDGVAVPQAEGHPLTPLSGTQNQFYFGTTEWPDGDIFADCSTDDYWASLGLNFDLDVAGNIFSISDSIAP
ncbi:hypothetical protein FDECE_14449 [Fusarium decemcellulare]|nr:hypothetical protein FDECE_14449 [Fusarium decemcellulare]